MTTVAPCESATATGGAKTKTRLKRCAGNDRYDPAPTRAEARADNSVRDTLDGSQAKPEARNLRTSGSTGGVSRDQAPLANYLLALQLELELDHNDRYLHTASISFSSSRRQLLLPLSQGATVVIATSEQRKDPLALFAMIKQRELR